MMKLLIIAFLVLGVLPTTMFAQTDDTCPDYPPVMKVEAVKFYTDVHGSVISEEKLHESLKLIAPLRKFVTDATSRVDSLQINQQQCAFQMMQSWAKAGAMLEKPDDFAGMRERLRFTIPLNITTMKLKAAGFDIAPLLGWLGRLNHEIINNFEKKQQVGNLYVWSGVSAVSFAFISGDSTARSYENTVWSHAVSMIRPDGFVDSELRRASKAMSYHEYYLSALLTLHAFRKTLGEAMTNEEHAAIKRLVDAVSVSLCDPSSINAACAASSQEKIRDIQYSPAIAFGRLGAFGDPLFGVCQPSNPPTVDPIVGGDFAKTIEALTKLRH